MKVAGRLPLARVRRLQDDFTRGGVTIVNPFAAARHPLLESLWGQGDAHE